MKNLSKNLLFGVLIFISLTLVFSLFTEVATPKPEILAINELAAKISVEEVKSITVNGNELEVLLSDGKTALARKESESGLSETLRNYGLESKDLQGLKIQVKDQGGWRYWLGILIPTLLPIIAIFVIFWLVFRQAGKGVNQAFSFNKANLRLFSPLKDKILFKDVAGLKEAKEELGEVVEFLRNAKKFLSMGAKIPRGVLLVGPPGCGKTLLARAVAGESGVPFFHISASEFVEMFVGVGASRVRDLFEAAKKAAPAIIFIDEIDAVGRERGSGMGGGHDEREQTLNQILVEMDGFERETNVIVMAATNRPDILDSALLRPGRFDRRVVLDMPDIGDREQILKIHSVGKPLAKDVDLRLAATRTPGFSGADLANLMNEAAIWAARHNRKEILQQDIFDSVEKVILGPERRSRTISPKEKEITAYHEAGHALVAAALEDADPVHKISIISRGMAGGYTLKLPLEDRHLKTRRQFLAEIATAFGGYIVEQDIFGDVSTGASSDLQQATELAHQMVTRYGMSALGPRTFGRSHEYTFFGKEFGSGRDYSEKFGELIDQEINKAIELGLTTAKQIIKKHSKALKEIADALLEKETLEKEEFAALMEKMKVKAQRIG